MASIPTELMIACCRSLRGGMHCGKSFDWDAMDRLHKKGLISDPVGRANDE
jgi:hypothetical protein